MISYKLTNLVKVFKLRYGSVHSFVESIFVLFYILFYFYLYGCVLFQKKKRRQYFYSTVLGCSML